MPAHSYKVSIRSMSPDHSWSKAFVQDLARKHERDTRGVLHMGLLEDLPHEKAARMFIEGDKSALLVCFPLLHPKHHKHYLRDVANLPIMLEADPRAIVIYDLADIPQEAQNGINVVTSMAVDMLIHSLEEKFPGPKGTSRIYNRTSALSVIASLLQS